MANKIIAFDTSPLSSGHKGRGVGTYTRELMRALKSIKHTDLELVFTDQPTSVGADLIHYPYFDLFFQTLPLAKKNKTIVTVHDVIPLKYPNFFPVGIKGSLKYHIQKYSLNSVDHVITDSHASKKDINHFLGINNSKITPVLLAASHEFKPVSNTDISQVKKKYDLPEKFLLFVGSVTHNKNLSFLIDTLSRMNTIPLVINTRTDLQSESSEKQTRMVLDDVNQALSNAPKGLVTVTVMDSVEDLNRLYNAATFYIQPSLAEGFGLPLLESMQAGTPVLSSNSTSLPEVGGNHALYFDPNDSDSLEAVINQALKISSKEVASLSEKSRYHAQKFTWSKTAEETIKVYQSVLKS